MDKLSYALGISLGQSMLGSGVGMIDFDDFLSGIKVVFLGRQAKISPEEGNQILSDYFDKMKVKKEEEQKKQREDNLLEANTYLEKNKTAENVIVTESGLQYKVLSTVDSKDPQETPTIHSRVKCHYEGRFLDGTVFDSSYQRGEPAVFSLEHVIPGWAEGLQLMRVGEKYEFTIPPQLGYGEVGIPGHLPGNKLLIFTVELLEIVE